MILCSVFLGCKERPNPKSELWVNIQDPYLGAEDLEEGVGLVVLRRYFVTRTIGGDARSGDHLLTPM